MSLAFQGEWMSCVVCDRRQKSDPDVSSYWTAVEIGDQRFYACPACVPGPFPEDPDEVQVAYERFVTAALLEMGVHL
ncbi:MAG: hypothetical protein E6H00_12885 [Bacillati bacterium ANGP1]|uniref:Uncharacterized protein n=1 Tax=Candidatus Segetimicrobium genomatis TaxID=2569760 RepID=A0A537JYI2_9BACT|nr:MAG: hypothetical protein E6H00_12885 [Terrabacteria group bacterium ANGP1]